MEKLYTSCHYNKKLSCKLLIAKGFFYFTLFLLIIGAAPAAMASPPRVLTFSPTSLSFTVIQNGSTASQTSTLSARTGTPLVTLSKSGNSNWLILPLPHIGVLSFNINASGLAPGTYVTTVTASANRYTSATLQITLVVVGKTLSFSPTSLSFSVLQDGSAANKSSTLSANTGTPSVTLNASANSNWLILPQAALGSLSFGINASGLAPGSYAATVNAMASGYTTAALEVTLTVTAKALSFSPTSLSFSVVQDGSTANKSATLSANTGAPSVTLTASANSSWLVLPQATLGSLSFGINASGLIPGSYTASVSAAATGYTSASLQVTLTVTASKILSFSPTSLSFSVVQNGSVLNKSSTLSATTGTPTVTLTASANSSWLILPSAALGPLSFGINSSNLVPGNYSATVTAMATGYTSGILQVTLTVTSIPTAINIKVNFQDSLTVSPSGWLSDYGQSYGVRTSANQGSGYFYGWLKRLDNTPLDLTKNGRKRSTPQDILLATLMHMQGGDIAGFTGTTTEGIWQIMITNGKYDVTVSTGDDTKTDSRHVINVEGVNAIPGFVPSSTQKFKSATVTVSVSDGYLTVDAIGGTNTKINWITIQSARPAVVSVNPADSSRNINENSSISTDILKLPNGGIDNATITSSSVYLTESISGAIVPSNVNGTGGGDAITLVPASGLKLNTSYNFNITSGVKDVSGASFYPYSSTFTTASNDTAPSIVARFTRVDLSNTTGRHSNVTIGPDGKLYALTIDGIIKRFTINPDGTLGTPELIYSLQDASGTRTPTLAVGFAFDPSATAANLIAWVTHDTYVFYNAPDWDGKLTKLSGDNLQTVTDVLINLPRSAKDHVTNSIAFGPDGALYFTQGSTSAMGAADPTWSNRSEHLLSAAVLRLDISKLGTLPLNVKTSEGGGTYSPYAVNAPLTIYASGVRNAYDLLWHSNGALYTATNGSAAGGNTPASVSGTLRPDGTTYSGPVIPALTNVQQTMSDYLFKIVKGGYYGHPNPLRGEYVLNGGNPTSAIDNAEVAPYPVGTLPDANWRGNVFNFQNNVSPNGTIEYKSNTFNGALKGKLMVVRYSQHDDIITLTPGPNKDIISYIEGNDIPGFSGFIDPLDLTEDVKTGNLYVSEYGGDSGKITLLKPDTASGAPRPTVGRQAFNLQKHPNTFPSCDETGPLPVTLIADSVKNMNVIQAGELNKIKIYPNPLQKRFHIQFPERYKGNYTIEIADFVGRNYDAAKAHLNGGRSNMEVDISHLSLKPGMYFLKVTSEERKTEVFKIILL